MLKHASNAGSGGGGGGGSSNVGSGGNGPINGTVRSNNNPPTNTQRSIHLRPQQPLNISTLSANTLQSANITANGGQRIPTTLLNIASINQTPAVGGQSGGGVSTAAPMTPASTTTPLTPIPPMTPITPMNTPNGGIGSNLHTYTNQYILAAYSNNNTLNTNNNNNNINNNNSTTICNNANNNTLNNNPNYSNCNNLTVASATPVSPSLLPHHTYHHNKSKHGPGPREALTSLGLLCLVSLLLALLSLIFLLKISPNGREDAMTRNSAEDFVIVYDVTLALCALSLSLNLCCLLVCAIQFLFAVKLVRSPMFDGRDNKYLEKSSASRTCAVGGFFISIPIFLTGIILYTFNNFHSTPAIITSVLIGIGIVFCGGAMVHNVFVWQKEKTISYRSPPTMNMSMLSQIGPITPPSQFLHHPHMHTYNHSHHQQQQQQQHQQQLHHLHHPLSVTPVSPNHSHGSFNPTLVGPNGLTGALTSTFIMRPSTATPPTPKPIANGCLTLSSIGSPAAVTTAAASISGVAREASGSISPGIPPTLDMSNITSPSLHELSTLV